MSIPVVLIGSLTLTPGSIIIADQQDLISILSIRPVPRRWHRLDPILTNAVFEDISNNITSPASVKDPTVYYRRCRNLCYTTFQGRLCTACVSDFWIWKTHFFFFWGWKFTAPKKKFTMLFRRPCCNCHLPTCRRSMEFVLDFSFE